MLAATLSEFGADLVVLDRLPGAQRHAHRMRVSREGRTVLANRLPPRIMGRPPRQLVGGES
jgi:hypothetical protein